MYAVVPPCTISFFFFFQFNASQPGSFTAFYFFIIVLWLWKCLWWCGSDIACYIPVEDINTQACNSWQLFVGKVFCCLQHLPLVVNGVRGGWGWGCRPTYSSCENVKSSLFCWQLIARWWHDTQDDIVFKSNFHLHLLVLSCNCISIWFFTCLHIIFKINPKSPQKTMPTTLKKRQQYIFLSTTPPWVLYIRMCS